MKAVFAQTGRARSSDTGFAGSRESSLVDKLVALSRAWRAVGIVAVDPSILFGRAIRAKDKNARSDLIARLHTLDRRRVQFGGLAPCDRCAGRLEAPYGKVIVRRRGGAGRGE